MRECQLIFAIWGILGAISISLINVAFYYSNESNSLFTEIESNSQMNENFKELLFKQIGLYQYSAQFFHTASYSALVLFLLISYVLTREWFFSYIEINSLAKNFKGYLVDLWLFRIFILFYLRLVLSVLGLVLVNSLKFIPPIMISVIIDISMLILIFIILLEDSKQRIKI